MEPSIEIYQPSRLYSWTGWAALAGSVVCVLCGLRAPLAFIPAFLCATTAAVLFWLAARPSIRVGETQFNIGERAIAWREVREINTSRFNTARFNTSRFVSPLILNLEADQFPAQSACFPGRPRSHHSSYASASEEIPIYPLSTESRIVITGHGPI